MVGGDHSFFVRFLPLGKDGVAPRKENASACFFLRLRSAAKNDALCRFLNALVRSPFIKYRKTKRTSIFACPFCWRRERDSNPCASFLTTAFRVRLVMTSSISLQYDYVGEMPNVCNIQHFAGFGNHIAAILQKSFN